MPFILKNKETEQYRLFGSLPILCRSIGFDEKQITKRKIINQYSELPKWLVVAVIKSVIMNTIIIENKAYSVSNKELKELTKREKQIKNEKDYNIERKLEMDLQFYIQTKIETWKCLGFIMFDFRL